MSKLAKENVGGRFMSGKNIIENLPKKEDVTLVQVEIDKKLKAELVSELKSMDVTIKDFFVASVKAFLNERKSIKK